MTDNDLSNRFDQLRDYVDLAVTVPSLVKPSTRTKTSRRRVLLPVLSAVVIVIVALSIAIATRGSTGRHTAAPTVPTDAAPAPVLSCPTLLPADSPQGYPLPPAGPNPLTVTDRLVPTVTPIHAVVCEYLGQHNPSAYLMGSRVIDTDLANIPATLGWVPPVTSRMFCALPAIVSGGDAGPDAYLIGLTYPTGTLWLSGPGFGCGGGTSNGQFATISDVGDAAFKAYDTGTWASPAPPSNSSVCQEAGGRLGQEKAMVPDKPVSLAVCGGDISKPVAIATATELAEMVAELNQLPTSAESFGCESSGVVPTAMYGLTFSYSTGPPVSIWVWEGCAAAIHNGNLEAPATAPVLATLQQIWAH